MLINSDYLKSGGITGDFFFYFAEFKNFFPNEHMFLLIKNLKVSLT